MSPVADRLVFEPPPGYAMRIAVIDADGASSYAQLVHAATTVGRFLQSTDGSRTSRDADDGVEPRIAFLEPPGWKHVALQWGIWRSGAISVPLALSHPARELEYVLDDAAPAAVIASADLADRIRDLAAVRGIRFAITEDIITRRTPDTAVRRVDHEGPASGSAGMHAGPNRRAMMVYTSGTTGRPKGVITTHGNIRSQIRTLVDAWGWRSDDRILHVLPLHHIHGIVNVLSCALWSGACCEFLPRFEAGAVWRRLASGDITVFMAVPTIYHRLIGEWESTPPRMRNEWSRGASRLRLMVSGSAALPVSTLERWREITGHTLLERYGMTEIGMALSNPLHGERRAGTVGRPLPGVEVRLVDDDGRIADPGTAGQIEVRGPQVFSEYWNRPDETREAFHHGWFRTGDEAVVVNGYHRILGRRSTDIIKSGGYKISALEIEDALRESDDVGDCAVVGVPDDDLGERVCAAVVPARGARPDAAALIEWAMTRLAAYKVPRHILFLDTLPTNAMGKVTKPAIRDLFQPPRS